MVINHDEPAIQVLAHRFEMRQALGNHHQAMVLFGRGACLAGATWGGLGIQRASATASHALQLEVRRDHWVLSSSSGALFGTQATWNYNWLVVLNGWLTNIFHWG